MISYCVAKKRKIIYEQKRLESKLQEAETKHKHSLSVESWDQVMAAKNSTQLIGNSKNRKRIIFTKV